RMNLCRPWVGFEASRFEPDFPSHQPSRTTRYRMSGRHHGRCFLALWFLAMVWVAPGCSGSGDDLPREAVSGTVKLDGQPLAGGVIRFTPGSPTDSGEGRSGGS